MNVTTSTTIQNVIKETHTAVVENNITELQNITGPPVPKALLSSKDANGLTPLHKAAGLGHLAIVEHLLRMNPSTACEADSTGKTPLHWASTLEIYNRLVQAGADELACDYVCICFFLFPALFRLDFFYFDFSLLCCPWECV